VKARTNVTLSLPEGLLRRFRIYAASCNQSMSSLVTIAVRQMVDQDAQTRAAKRRFVERIRNLPIAGPRA
jgi:CopG-like RHH_1 or ribbon-helix-helix domain, RHH_5